MPVSSEEVKINIQDAFKRNMSDGDGCSAAEPFALRTIDDSMEPEFNTGCIIIIDPGNVARDESYVFAVDNTSSPRCAEFSSLNTKVLASATPVLFNVIRSVMIYPSSGSGARTYLERKDVTWMNEFWPNRVLPDRYFVALNSGK